MNQLSLDRRAAIVRCLVDGNSIRATCRITGASKNTVTKLLVDLGEVCSLYQSHVIRNLPAKRIQCDEIWSFVGAKARAVKAGANGDGDIFTWTALDADTKLMISWLVGRRSQEAARAFMLDLAGRVTGRPQLTTDGHAAYLAAVDEAFGWRVDYAMLVKVYAGRAGTGNDAKYSPPVCIGGTRCRSGGCPTRPTSRPRMSSGKTSRCGWGCGGLPG
jgi:hypothetical protein